MQTLRILDMKEHFERIKEHDLYAAKDMIATQNGTVLSNATLITELNCSTSISVLVKSALPVEDLDIHTNSLYQNLCQENVSFWSDEPNSENVPDHSMLWENSADWDFADSMLDFGVYVENHEVSHTITKGDCPLEEQDVLAAVAENTSVTAAQPLTEQASGQSVILENEQVIRTQSIITNPTTIFSVAPDSDYYDPMPGPSSTFVPTSAPAPPENASDDVMRPLHGGREKLLVPEIFREESKQDGLVCVIEPTKCSLPTILKGYRVDPNKESLECTFNPMSYKGVKLYWREIRGQLWARRCLSLHEDTNGFNIVQWRRFPIRKKAPETINHLLVGCTFAREFWFRFLSQVGLQSFSPQLSDSSFYDWWERASNDKSGDLLHGFNSLIILGAWTLWTQRNKCVFDGAVPDLSRALTMACEERKMWSFAGARGNLHLWNR